MLYLGFITDEFGIGFSKEAFDGGAIRLRHRPVPENEFSMKVLRKNEMRNKINDLPEHGPLVNQSHLGLLPAGNVTHASQQPDGLAAIIAQDDTALLDETVAPVFMA